MCVINGVSRTSFESVVRQQYFLGMYYAPATMVSARDVELDNLGVDSMGDNGCQCCCHWLVG